MDNAYLIMDNFFEMYDLLRVKKFIKKPPGWYTREVSIFKFNQLLLSIPEGHFAHVAVSRI
jgi:hypothetical protein